MIKHKNTIDFNFEILSKAKEHDARYSYTCSGGVSYCCTRTCRGNDHVSNSEDKWATYYNLNAGVVQY